MKPLPYCTPAILAALTDAARSPDTYPIPAPLREVCRSRGWGTVAGAITDKGRDYVNMKRSTLTPPKEKL